MRAAFQRQPPLPRASPSLAWQGCPTFPADPSLMDLKGSKGTAQQSRTLGSCCPWPLFPLRTPHPPWRAPTVPEPPRYLPPELPSPLDTNRALQACVSRLVTDSALASHAAAPLGPLFAGNMGAGSMPGTVG
mmetsp:Transcript_46768/g.83782  ORF Transcript_46768/g.83782 Transcript_46768/m.83782 type:complete len:132 (-) Transcript_46768:14-409(-)